MTTSAGSLSDSSGADLAVLKLVSCIAALFFERRHNLGLSALLCCFCVGLSLADPTFPLRFLRQGSEGGAYCRPGYGGGLPGGPLQPPLHIPGE